MSSRRLVLWTAPVLAISAFVAAAGLLFYVVPRQVVTSRDVPSAERRLKLQNDVRTTGVQLLGGVLLAAGAIFSLRTLRLNREGQITERYSRAVDQLGGAKLQVRLGGIYALERIARESSRDHGPIFEVLCAFARTRKRQLGEGEGALPDVQAVLEVISRRKSVHDPGPDLLTLDDGDLRACSIESAQCRRASLQGVDLRACVIADSDFRYSLFIDADLRNAFLDADFRYAVFSGANLADAMIFEGARFDDALYTAETVWPDSFDARAAGMKLIDPEAFEEESGIDS
jgi:Pentapeptide repeats (9 copies)